MKKYILHFVILLLSFYSMGCGPQKETGNILTRKGKRIALIDSLEVYNVEQNSFSKLSDLLKPGQKKIIVSLDAAACFSCSDDFVIWQNIIDSAKNKNIEFLFYLHTLDFEKIKPYFRKWRFYHPVIIDRENKFYEENGLVVDKVNRAMIVDKDNRLLYVGNPLYSTDHSTYYTRFLKEQM